MTEELKIIKKLYGENMAHFCRDTFPSILEIKGKLLDALKSNFAESHDLYIDLKAAEMLDELKKYIYDLFEVDDNEINVIDKTPEELLKMTGYTLYECKTEDDIQFFRKYYANGEELCTFRGNRLNSCYVFFAVKDNVETIKRENFKNPERQDLYGTSVISIQFTRDKSHTLSIKNRYNHTVSNPDATFSNNLDNIISGLTESFEKTYGLKQEHRNGGFEIPGYVRANDGRWYKYNYEMSYIYYCSDNIIIDNGKVKRYAKEKYIVLDYYILDLEKKELYFYDVDIEDSLLDVIGRIKKIVILKKEGEKEVKIINDKDEEIIITIDKNNKSIGLKSIDIKLIRDGFMQYNEFLRTLDLPNLYQVGDCFLNYNESLCNLSLPSLIQAGDSFLAYNKLRSLDLPKLQIVGSDFFSFNNSLTILNLPMLQKVGADFLYFNEFIKEVKLPSLQYVGKNFLFFNDVLKCLDLPNLRTAEENFLYHNETLEFVNLPLLQRVGFSFLFSNKSLKLEKYMLLKKLYMFWFKKNIESSKINLPNLEVVDSGFIANNEPVRRDILRRIKH